MGKRIDWATDAQVKVRLLIVRSVDRSWFIIVCLSPGSFFLTFGGGTYFLSQFAIFLDDFISVSFFLDPRGEVRSHRYPLSSVRE